MPGRTPVRPALIGSILLGLTAGLLAPMAPAAAEPVSVSALGADLVAVHATVDGGIELGLKPAGAAVGMDAAVAVIDVPGTDAVSAHLSAADLVPPTDVLPAGPVSIELQQFTGPEGGRIHVTEAGTSAVLLDTEGGRVVTVDPGQRRASEWSFSVAGDYTVTFQATLPVTRTAVIEAPAPQAPPPEAPAPPADPADGAETPAAPVEPAPQAPAEPPPATIVTTETRSETLASPPVVYTFRVAEPAAVNDDAPIGDSGAPAVEPSRHPHGSTTAAGATVLNDGEVALEWIEGVGGGYFPNRLSYHLDGEARYIDPAAAILQMTPQTLTDIAAGYEALGAIGEPAWITPGSPSAGAMQFGWSTRHLTDGDGEGGLDVLAGASTGPGQWGVFNRTGGLLLSPVIAGHDRVTVPDDEFQPLALGFAAEGLYCLTLSHQFILGDGRQVSGGNTVRVAVGDIDLSGIPALACNATEQPDLGVPNGTINDAGAVVLNAGSVDIHSALDGGHLTTSVRDWATGGESLRDPRDVVLNVTSDALQVDPELAALYPWLGAPGSSSRLIDPNGEFVVGWTAEQIAAESLRGEIEWELTGVTGPGSVALVQPGYDEHWNEIFNVLFDEVGDTTTIAPGDARNGLWAFNGDGVYCLAFTQTATLAGGGATSTQSVLTFAVGDVDAMAVDPSACFADWNVENGTTTRSGATILNVGHIDIASRVSGGELETVIKDDGVAGADPALRDPAGVVMQALPASFNQVDSTWHDFAPFLDDSITGMYVLPEVQEDDILWAGWSTELIDPGATIGGVEWTFTDMEGPGELYVFDSGNGFSARLLFNSTDGFPDSQSIAEHAHRHGTWAFTEAGVYCIASTRTATLASGEVVRSHTTLTFGVGEIDIRGVDPGDCFDGAPNREDTPATRLPAQPSDEFALVGGDSHVSGSTVFVEFSNDQRGRWLSPWLHSEPFWFGWTRVHADNRLAVTLPAGAAPGIHKLVIKDADGSVLGWRPITITASAPPPAPAPPSASIPASQCVAGATILSAGHVDYATRLIDGRLQSLVKDGTSAGTVWREPSGTVLWLKPSARMTSQGGVWSFLGPAGATAWNAPQTQNPDLVWLGWNTQELGAAQVAGAVQWSLDRVDGPGAVTIYTVGSFGTPTVLLQRGGSTSIPVGTHAHGNWGFTAQGVYRLTFTQSVTLAGGGTSSDTETLTIVVGDVDPATAVSGGSGCDPISADLFGADATAAATTNVAAEALDRDADTATTPDTEPESLLEQLSSPAVLIGVLAGLLLIAGGAAWWYLRRASAQRPPPSR